jgi:hypothetical protein
LSHLNKCLIANALFLASSFAQAKTFGLSLREINSYFSSSFFAVLPRFLNFMPNCSEIASLNFWLASGLIPIYFLNATSQTPPSLPLVRGGAVGSVANIYQIGMTRLALSKGNSDSFFIFFVFYFCRFSRTYYPDLFAAHCKDNHDH